MSAPLATRSGDRADVEEAWGMTVFATTQVAILDPVTAQPVGECPGPTPDNRCSLVSSGSALPCAGHPIRCQIAGQSRRLRFFVDHDRRQCSLARCTRTARLERR